MGQSNSKQTYETFEDKTEADLREDIRKDQLRLSRYYIQGQRYTNLPKRARLIRLAYELMKLIPQQLEESWKNHCDQFRRLSMNLSPETSPQQLDDIVDRYITSSDFPQEFTILRKFPQFLNVVNKLKKKQKKLQKYLFRLANSLPQNINMMDRKKAFKQIPDQRFKIKCLFYPVNFSSLPKFFKNELRNCIKKVQENLSLLNQRYSSTIIQNIIHIKDDSYPLLIQIRNLRIPVLRNIIDTLTSQTDWLTLLNITKQYLNVLEENGDITTIQKQFMFSVHKYNKQIYISTILLFPTGGTEIYRENQLPDLAKLLSNSPLLGRNVGQSFDNPLIETKIFNWRYESYCKQLIYNLDQGRILFKEQYDQLPIPTKSFRNLPNIKMLSLQ